MPLPFRNSLHGVSLLLTALLLSMAACLHAQTGSLDDVLSRAQAEQSSGQYATAAADYAHATSLDGTVAELWANRGLMEYLAGQKPQAIVSFLQALALKPQLITPMLFLGKAYLETGKPEMGLPPLKKAHAMRPDDIEILLTLGSAYEAIHEPGKAAAAYKQATEVSPSQPAAWFGRGVTALALIERDGRILANKDAASLWARALYADDLLAQGRRTEAENIYQNAVATASPEQAELLAETVRQELLNPAVFALSADTAASLQRLLPQLKQKSRVSAQVRCPAADTGTLLLKTTDAFREQAACAFWHAQFDLSAEQASHLLISAPTDPVGLYWSVKANERIAVAALSRFEQLAPHSAATSDMVGDLYRRQRQPDNALQQYQKALAIDPHDPAAHLGIAAVYLSEGQFEETIAAAQAGLADHPDDAQLNLLMAEGLVAQHHYDLAKPYLHQSLSAPPELLLRVHALLGKIDAEEGDTAAAIAELKLALPADEDGSLHYQLFRLYRKAGDLAAAKQAEAAARTIEAQRRQRAVTAVESSLADTR